MTKVNNQIYLIFIKLTHVAYHCWGGGIFTSAGCDYLCMFFRKVPDAATELVDMHRTSAEALVARSW